MPPPKHRGCPAAHGAGSGAGGDIAAFLFPRDASALLADQEQLAQSRLWAGIHYQTDIDTGLALGRSVAQAVISARGKIDGGPSPAAAAPPGPGASRVSEKHHGSGDRVHL